MALNGCVRRCLHWMSLVTPRRRTTAEFAGGGSAQSMRRMRRGTVASWNRVTRAARDRDGPSSWARRFAPLPALNGDEQCRECHPVLGSLCARHRRTGRGSFSNPGKIGDPRKEPKGCPDDRQRAIGVAMSRSHRSKGGPAGRRCQENRNPRVHTMGGDVAQRRHPRHIARNKPA